LKWTGIPAQGYLLARLPRISPSGFFSPDGEERAFVPITAAGQRGLFTPLPHIHLFRNVWQIYMKLEDLVNSKKFSLICFVDIRI
jgi:hypothetical protein